LQFLLAPDGEIVELGFGSKGTRDECPHLLHKFH
jgi:hypothetical protein